MAAVRGIHFDANEDPVRIFPRIESELRTTQIALPGTSLSLGIKSFVYCLPWVLFAGSVVLRYRIDAISSVPASVEPWIIADARAGLPGLLALLWLGLLCFGPWVLSVLLVDILSLELQARGPLDLSGSFLLSSYAIIIIVILIASSKSLLLGVLRLRSRIRSSELKSALLVIEG
jgi:hypothetical protein